MTQEQIDKLVSEEQVPLALMVRALSYINHQQALSKLLTKTDCDESLLRIGLRILKELNLENTNIVFTSPESRNVTIRRMSTSLGPNIIEDLKASAGVDVYASLEQALTMQTALDIQLELDKRRDRKRTLYIGLLPAAIQFISEKNYPSTMQLVTYYGVK